MNPPVHSFVLAGNTFYTSVKKLLERDLVGGQGTSASDVNLVSRAPLLAASWKSTGSSQRVSVDE